MENKLILCKEIFNELNLKSVSPHQQTDRRQVCETSSQNLDLTRFDQLESLYTSSL